MSLIQTYPPARLGYYTLTNPSTITNYCFSQNCPREHFSYSVYDSAYTQRQYDQQQLGLARYLNSRQWTRDDNINGNPVFNSNMRPLVDNNMKYFTEVHVPVSPWSIN